MKGQRIKQYEILNKVGSGGMAIVYRARDTHTGCIAAVKAMHPHNGEPR